jgi:hypothetical protein
MSIPEGDAARPWRSARYSLKLPTQYAGIALIGKQEKSILAIYGPVGLGSCLPPHFSRNFFGFHGSHNWSGR